MLKERDVTTLLTTITHALITADNQVSPEMDDAEYDDYELRAHYVIDALRLFKPTELMVGYGYGEVTTDIERDSRDLPHVWEAMMIAAKQEAESD